MPVLPQARASKSWQQWCVLPLLHLRAHPASNIMHLRQTHSKHSSDKTRSMPDVIQSQKAQ